jgi:DNA repair exonuclease SbcCD ATPase subunit
MCKQTGTKGDTICDIELGNNPIKKNSIKYIEEQEKCPVCNKPIENKEKMMMSIDQEMDIERNCCNASSQVKQAINEHAKIDREIEAKNKKRIFLKTY